MHTHPLLNNPSQAQALRQRLACVGQEYDELHRQLVEYTSNADEDEADSLSRAMAAENALMEERALKEEAVVELKKMKTELEKQTADKMYFENLAKENEGLLEREEKLRKEAQIQLEKISVEKLLLETEVAEFNTILDEIQVKQEQTRSIMIGMTARRSLMHDARSTNRVPRRFTMFSRSALMKATNGFHPDSKIGRAMYKGHMRSMPVVVYKTALMDLGKSSILVTHPGMRHQHLLSPIGGCEDPKSLVYEYLPGGSLKDRLQCKDGKPPLKWERRVRIATEICSTLIFLHSAGTVCFFLRPSRVILDANLSAKILSVSVNLDNVSSSQRYDIIQLGTIILQLLTGKLNIHLIMGTKKVERALQKNYWKKVVDPSAGEWPQDIALHLANLGLQCCRNSREMTIADLKSHAQGIITSMNTVSTVAMNTTSPRALLPEYFLCPISREIMRDPQVAADGFTYDREELLEWFSKGHKTSPMTNAELHHLNLTPNHALRSAIQEWLGMDSVE